MASKDRQEKAEAGSLSVLRAAALIAVLVGAAGSVGLMVHAGHRTNSPRTLLVLFTLWVLSPFVVLVFAIIASKDWSVLARATLYCVVVFLTVSSLAIFGDVAFGPPRTKTAFAFVAVPPASWLLIAITVLIPGLISRRGSRRSNDG
jgi:hypothetical protein